MKFKGRRDEDVPAEAIEAARALPPTPGLEGFPGAVILPDPNEIARDVGYDSQPIRSTDVLPGKPVHKRGHRV